MNLTTGIALYAAVVSTSALTLSLRKWFLTGPVLALSVMARGKTHGRAEPDDREYIVLNVTNRGDLPTTLSTMAVFQYRTIFHRWRRKPYYAAIIPRPDLLGGVGTPSLIAPGTTWMGAVIYNDELIEMAKSGKLFVAIHSSHSERPALAKVRWMESAEEKIARLAADAERR
ncbi:MAG: hypothetical protein ACMVO5_12570 [Polymorphobacter sp.]|uniref:hypothetical protein n=1 Tax=Polymorphobacter sp. TaxID=1909290 RepID=UPI003A8BC59C